MYLDVGGAKMIEKRVLQLQWLITRSSCMYLELVGVTNRMGTILLSTTTVMANYEMQPCMYERNLNLELRRLRSWTKLCISCKTVADFSHGLVATPCAKSSRKVDTNGPEKWTQMGR
jgi:hypothetical protein